MTSPNKNATSETPRTDHYRAEFKRRKETSELIEWMLDEFAQEERRLRDAEGALNYATAKLHEEIEADRAMTRALALAEAAERGKGMVMVPYKLAQDLNEALCSFLNDEKPFDEANRVVDAFHAWEDSMLSTAEEKEDEM